MSKSARLTREALLQANDLKTEELEVPEWGGSILISSWTLEKRNALVEQARQDGVIDGAKMQLLAVIDGITDPRLTAEDIEVLKGKSASALDRVAAAILKLNGMDVRAVDNALKNSETTAS